MVLLITSGIEKKFKKKKESVLYAGDWVLSNKINSNKFLKKNKVFKTFWENTKKIDDFEIKIFILRKKIINNLFKQLSKLHKVTYSKQEWTVIIDPWLTYYLQSYYFRWLTVENILKKYKKMRCIFFKNLTYLAPLDQNEFQDLMLHSDEFNHFAFQRILRFFHFKKQYYLDFSEQIFLKKKKKNVTINNINYKFFFNKLLMPFAKNNKYYIELNCGIFIFIKLNLLLGQLPFKANYFFEQKDFLDKLKKQNTYDLNLRKSIKLNFDMTDDFESYISQYIIKDIPTVFLENFNKINDYTKNISLDPKIIVSDTKYRHNTIFKFWLAKSLNNGKKLVTSDHGGLIGNTSIKILMQDEITNISTKWHKALKKKNTQMPAIFLLNLKKKRNLKKKYLLIVTGYSPRYPYFYHAGEIGGQILTQVEDVKNLYLKVPREIKREILIKSHPQDDNSWYLKERIKKFIKNEDQFINNNKSLRFIKNSKIILCTSPKTAFYQSMFLGPTILLYNSKYFRDVKKIQDVMDLLKKAKIVFESSNEAAEHIKNVWNNIDHWWEDKFTNKAKEAFFSTLAYNDSKSLIKWRNFLKKIYVAS